MTCISTHPHSRVMSTAFTLFQRKIDFLRGCCSNGLLNSELLKCAYVVSNMLVYTCIRRVCIYIYVEVYRDRMFYGILLLATMKVSNVKNKKSFNKNNKLTQQSV